MVDLIGEVCFPNIELATNLINFGSILNDTSKKMSITMRNVSEMGLNYEWTFVEEEFGNSLDGSRQQSRGSVREGGSGHGAIPINEVFDILPLSGYL